MYSHIIHTEIIGYDLSEQGAQNSAPCHFYMCLSSYRQLSIKSFEVLTHIKPDVGRATLSAPLHRPATPLSL